jgi:hypothetical protein
MEEETPKQPSDVSSGTIGLSSQTPSSDIPHLTYEETPVIESVKEPIYSSPPSYASPTPPRPPLSFLKAAVGFVILFIIGFAVSGILRQALAPKTETKENETVILPTATPIEDMTSMLAKNTTLSGVLSVTGWKTYPVLNGTTRKAIENISFQLPSDTLAPTCDGGSCSSQGTYLSGGTRFTVAPRGQGQVLADYRSRAISDLRGNAFTVKETTIAGKKAVEFSGSFTGSTAQGFGFTKMHGYMIEVTDTISLEMNHFIPSGVTADFENDDVIFEQIVKSLTFVSAPVVSPIDTVMPTKIMSPTGTVTPTKIMTATPSATQ